MLVTFKQEVDHFLSVIIRDTILPVLRNELSFAEHRMDINDPFTREKILTLNELIKRLESSNTTEIWSFEVREDLTMDLKFVEEFELIFNKIDNGTKYIPQIKIFDKLTSFVNSLLGVGNT